MRLLFQIRFSTIACPASYSTSTDTRLLAIRFLELRAFRMGTKEEILDYKFHEHHAGDAVEHLYGLGEVEESGVWSTASKSAIIINIPQYYDDLSFEIKYAVLDFFPNGIDVAVSLNGDDYKFLHLDGKPLSFYMQGDQYKIEQAIGSQGDTSSSRRDAIVVLGMHRSGTSALTRLISLAGAHLPLNLMPSQPDNPTGFWESQKIASANDMILNSVGSRWDDPTPANIHDAIKKLNLPGLVDLINEEYAGSNLIVIKDPRMSLLVDLWDQVLRKADYRIQYIAAMRHPLDVAHSLHARNKMPIDYSVLLWTRYVLAILDSSIESTFVNFDDIIDRPMGLLHEIAENIGSIRIDGVNRAVDAVSKFIDPQHNHSRNANRSVDENVKPAVDLYEAVVRHGKNVNLYEPELSCARIWFNARTQLLKYGLEYKLKSILGS